MTDRENVTFDPPKRDIQAAQRDIESRRDIRDMGGVGGGISTRKSRDFFKGNFDVTGECHAPDVTANVTVKRDISACRLRHHAANVTSTTKPATTWLHIGAMNVLADHKAGIHVDPAKLALARSVLGLTKEVS